MRLRYLLRPGWLAVTALVLIFAVACFTLLAPWQFRRHEERRATNAAVQAALSAAPVPLESAPGEWRLATLRGGYLSDGEAVARLRTVAGEPAFEVLTPFRLTDGSVVLVDRGFVRPNEMSRIADYPAPPAGTVDLVARVRSDETDPQHRAAFTEGGRRQVYAIDSRTVAAASGLAIRPGYLRLEPGSPGGLGPIPLPQLESGPFLAYALQWLAFGAMALLGWAYFSWREIRPGGALAAPRPEKRRRSVAERVAEEEAAERAAADGKHRDVAFPPARPG